MPTQVTLTITQGNLKGQEFTFDSRTTCLIGRADECHPQLPDDDAHRIISRYHCLLDINPPNIRVRDFGSKNGTYLRQQQKNWTAPTPPNPLTRCKDAVPRIRLTRRRCHRVR